MADPQHTPDMDGHDRLTVRLYRVGLAVVAVGLLAAAAGQLAVSRGGDVDPRWGWALISAGAALAVANLHLYDKRIRWVIPAFAWTGLTLQLAAQVIPAPQATDLVTAAGLGFVFAALSGVALKEQFCFRIPLLRATPLVLAASLIPLVFGAPGPSAALLGTAGVLYGLLAAAKALQPLHFDIGDKSRYQV